ncbi:MAG TPA: hypothetical protein DCS89_01570 [Gammaproteobacteria bacterium]|nr:hypothetical protein [Gammaproteobacteria bacterium]HAT25674.1 hypothetical protein [Gammaproteobacteria bacterium]
MRGSLKLESTIKCPHCGYQQTETMPTEFCQFFYDCGNCGKTLRPLHADCFVFCSYGTVPCPSMQAGTGLATS